MISTGMIFQTMIWITIITIVEEFYKIRNYLSKVTLHREYYLELDQYKL